MESKKATPEIIKLRFRLSMHKGGIKMPLATIRLTGNNKSNSPCKFKRPRARHTLTSTCVIEGPNANVTIPTCFFAIPPQVLCTHIHKYLCISACTMKSELILDIDREPAACIKSPLHHRLVCSSSLLHDGHHSRPASPILAHCCSRSAYTLAASQGVGAA